jgi:hypothetical protein
VYQQQQQQEEQQQQDAENPFLDPPFSRIKNKLNRDVSNRILATQIIHSKNKNSFFHAFVF